MKRDLKFDRFYPHPPERVWKALTDHREFGTWFRVRLESAFAPGKPTRGQKTAQPK